MSLELFSMLELRLARLLFRLPTPAQRLLGGAPIRVDGQTLCPEQQLLLRAQRWRPGRSSLGGGSVKAARERMRRDLLALNRDPPSVAQARELILPGAAGSLRARHYAPHAPAGTRPLLVFLHGGGFVLGDLDTHDWPCRFLCHAANLHVLSVEYRLAPEHPFPAALDDALCALRWAQAHAAQLGADAARVAVGGDSAGGNIAAVTAQRALYGGGRGPCLQLLIYPGVDRATPRPSWELFASDSYLTRADMAWFDGHYGVLDPALRRDPRVSPLLAESLVGIGPTLLVTAGFDPLRDEGEAYARALARAGNRVECWRESALLHGFLNMAGFSPTALRALSNIAARLHAMLEEGLACEPQARTAGGAPP
jgi:acetyl esterase